VKDLEDELEGVKGRLAESGKTITKLQIELQQKDKPLQEKQRALTQMERKLADLQARHERELETLRQELKAYKQSEMHLLNQNKLQQLQLDFMEPRDQMLFRPESVNKRDSYRSENAYSLQMGKKHPFEVSDFQTTGSQQQPISADPSQDIKDTRRMS